MRLKLGLIGTALFLGVLFGFQNCASSVGFKSSTTNSSSTVPSPTPAGSQCVSNKGNVCQTSQHHTVLGCGSGSICAGFMGAWIHMGTPGCSPMTGEGGDPNNTDAPSWVAINGPKCIALSSGTLVFNPDGACHDISSVYGSQAYTMLVAWRNQTDCTSQQPVPGLIQCDGSCR